MSMVESSLKSHGIILWDAGTLAHMESNHFKEPCDLGDGCPLQPAHARLNEAHRHWHDAADAYADPEGFRTYLNACVQTLRNVTFVVQKQKSGLPAFDDWYSRWQEYLKSDPILRWVVDARNRIVKQGDLETKSLARVAVVFTYDDPPHAEFEVKPSTPTPLILELLLATKPKDLPKELLDAAFLKVERRWVVEDLPDHELLDALAHAFGVLRSLVRDAHRLLASVGSGASSDASARAHVIEGPPACMIATQELRTACVKARTGQPLQVHRTPWRLIPPEVVRSHYGALKPLSLRKRTGSRLSDLAELFFGHAKEILERDGCHQPMICLLSKKEAHIRSLAFRDRAEKYLMWRSVAAEVERLGATTVIGVSESWFAPFDPQHPERHAVDSPDRTEALSLIAASEGGERASITCQFERVDGKIVLGETIKDADDGIGMFLPIYQVWSRRKSRQEHDKPSKSAVPGPRRKDKRRKRRRR